MVCVIRLISHVEQILENFMLTHIHISGWIAELEMTDSSGLENLMNEEAYRAYLADGA